MVFWRFTSGSPQELDWGIENQKIGQTFCLGVYFENVFSPKGLAKELHQNVKMAQCLDLIACTVLPDCTFKFDATKTPRMHLNTCPTCFEGPWIRRTGFRDPGPGNRV